jgi:hypothetical protein
MHYHIFRIHIHLLSTFDMNMLSNDSKTPIFKTALIDALCITCQFSHLLTTGLFESSESNIHLLSTFDINMDSKQSKMSVECIIIRCLFESSESNIHLLSTFDMNMDSKQSKMSVDAISYVVFSNLQNPCSSPKYIRYEYEV